MNVPCDGDDPGEISVALVGGRVSQPTDYAMSAPYSSQSLSALKKMAQRREKGWEGNILP